MFDCAVRCCVVLCCPFVIVIVIVFVLLCLPGHVCAESRSVFMVACVMCCKSVLPWFRGVVLT